MFNFKKTKPTIMQPPKTTAEIIEEIHETFYTEVDRLLEEAKIQKPLETTKQDIIDRADRLRRLGFTMTKDAIEAGQEERRLLALESENKEKQTLVDAINYFSFKYPQYKFITEDSVKKICKKYELVYGEVQDYLGSVPEKNLEQMEQFKVQEEDECYMRSETFLILGWGSRPLGNTLYFDKAIYEKYKQRDDLDLVHSNTIIAIGKCPLEIAAPQKDFNTKDKTIIDFKVVEIPDPVVLKPVVFNNRKYYLIVTAWGLEASDELVVNQKMN